MLIINMSNATIEVNKEEFSRLVSDVKLIKNILLSKQEYDDELTVQDIQDIQKAEEERAKGIFYTIDDVNRVRQQNGLETI